MPAIRALLKLFPEQLAQTNLPGVSSFLVVTVGDEIVGCCALQVYSKRLTVSQSDLLKKEARVKRASEKKRAKKPTKQAHGPSTALDPQSRGQFLISPNSPNLRIQQIVHEGDSP